MSVAVTCTKLIASADEIDNRLGPIPGCSSDRIARELRQAAAALGVAPAAEAVVAEFEAIFGALTATERRWLTCRIAGQEA